ncbi:hypothetical protein AMATHDRAFT_144505 [Amanita thiersii Skay4041]|uniref:DNA-binding protein n=1 Tax=Amanita thiersii Skay4041 TaxID=703135 RepID=A0A2A9NMY3_9AGAR|nr:hypothetical protein AMATHDRAFT_144505 [Amanita thiersii Skay4041]
MSSVNIPQIQPTSQSQDGSEEEAKRAQEEQMRRDLLATILDTAARERLSRIALVSPETSSKVERIIIQNVQAGAIRGRMSEEQLISLLDQFEKAQGTSANKKPTIVYQRRKDLDDDLDF